MSLLRSGQRSARTARELAGILQVSERQVRAAVDVLIKERHEPLASSTEAPAGYFRLATEEERVRYRAQLLSRIEELRARVRAVDSVVVDCPRPSGQLALL